MRRFRLTASALLCVAGIFLSPTAAPAAMKDAGALIESFTVGPSEHFRPGDELTFLLEGTPGGKATVRVSGVPGTITLREVRAGVYSGAYTVRSSDRIAPSAPMTATLTARGRTAVASVVVYASPPVPIAQRPAARTPAPVAEQVGASADVVASREVAGDTREKSIPPPVVAQEEARGALQPGGVPLEITSHRSHARVASGATEVHGRTVPNAEIDVTVRQSSLIVPGLFGVDEELLKQTVRADANGDFAFRFEPRSEAPETRFDINLRARTPEVAGRDVQLVLIQHREAAPGR